MKRWTILLYGIFSYLMFHAVFLYAVLFVGDLWITNTLDSAPTVGIWTAIIVNFGLLTAFAIQHSGMARQPVKDWLKKYIPESAERSTYVLMSNVAMILMFAFWQPMGGGIWLIENTTMQYCMYGLYFIGWAIVLHSTFAISHWDLFGLRQVWLQFNNKPYTHFKFRIPGAYKYVRHPLYVGWLMVAWMTPTMTLSHFLFAFGVTGYILVAIQLEERDLIGVFGKKYSDYRKSVPMLIPRLFATRTPIEPTNIPESVQAVGASDCSSSMITRLPE